MVIDILENDIIEKYPNVLQILLCDHTTQQNIFWATDNYAHLGKDYGFGSPILPALITGENGNIIMPRVYKDKMLQQARAKEMAEVFTPSWVCNKQINAIDNTWFGREGVFNKETKTNNLAKNWEVNKEKITFPEGKTWVHYVIDTRLEITCGEAPYITSRYDTTTGEFIAIENRIGMLDRKLRVINENVELEEKWFQAATVAYQNIYAFEWQGDSLLLAREAMLITFIENYISKFEKEPSLVQIQYIAHVISWNIWQMDGLKGVIPNSCKEVTEETTDLFSSAQKTTKCPGCQKQKILIHNGIYCKIMNWNYIEEETGKKSIPILFIDMFEK